MIDYLSLLLQPTAPTNLANLFGNALSEFVWERGETYCLTFFAAMRALNNVGHSNSPCEEIISPLLIQLIIDHWLEATPTMRLMIAGSSGSNPDFGRRGVSVT